MTDQIDVRRQWAPKMERPYPGESQREATQRRHRNREARKDWELLISARCAQCGMARINVVHEQDPATSIEGPTYYSDFLDELHAFVPVVPGAQLRSVR